MNRDKQDSGPGRSAAQPLWERKTEIIDVWVDMSISGFWVHRIGGGARWNHTDELLHVCESRGSAVEQANFFCLS